jgi:uncharacterized protein (TIGR03663 family)
MELKAKLKDHWLEIAILVVAAVARLVLLGMKPPHFDEGVNGWFVDQIKQTGYYPYDPTNYHGPFHFYVLFLAQTLLGRHVWALRLPLVLASLACIWLMFRFDRFISRGATLWAGAAMSLSPGSVFYARYAIHEYWLVFSLMLIAWGFAGMWQEGKAKYLWAVWIGVTGAVLNKETYLVHFAVMALTFPSLWVLGLMSPASGPARAKQEWKEQDMIYGFIMLVVCTLAFYSGFFMDVSKLKGLYQAFGAWAHTGKTGNGHEKPWPYWLELFWRYEWTAAIGLAAALVTVLPRTPRVVRGLAIYGIGALAAYSIIPYKTPWCIISLTWPFLLLFGWGVDYAWKNWPAIVTVGSSAVLIANGCDMLRLNYQHYTDASEPYVYVQTFSEVNLLMDPINKLVAMNPTEIAMSGHILMESYHPLPWLLGDFTNIGYYDSQMSPTDKMDADFLMVDQDRIDDVESKLHDSYFTWTFKLRDAEDPSKLYLNAKTFAPVFPGRQPDFVKGSAPADATPAATP